MQGDSTKWLEEFRRINAVTVTGRDSTVRAARLDRITLAARLPSNNLAQLAHRKGPHRLDNIIRGDSLAIRIANLKLRKRKPARSSR